MSIPRITLKAARVNAKMTQKEAAEKLDISVETLANYEKGRSFPDVITLKKIELLYGVGYDGLIFFSENYG